MTIDTRFLAIGRDRLCTRCGGAGAYVPASGITPRRIPSKRELAAYHSGRPGDVRGCERCHGIGLEPTSRVLDGEATSSDIWPAAPAEGPAA